MKKIIYILVIVTIAMLFAVTSCGKPNNQTDKEDNKTATPTSISIQNTETTVGVGEFEITAKVLPENADQRYTVSVIGAPNGIESNGNKVIVAGTAENGLSFTVKVVSLLDMLVEDRMTFTVVNNGTAAIEIRTAEEFSAIRNDLSGNYILMNDIDLNNQPWEPIGTPDMEDDKGVITVHGVGFAGRLNGNGYAIKNLLINDSTKELCGLFGQIEKSGIVEKLSLQGEVNAYRWFGALAGLNHGIVRNCFIDVNVTGVGFPVSAIAGNNKGTVENTLAVGRVVAAEGAHGAAFVGSTDGNVVSSFAHSGNIPYAFGWGKQTNSSIQKTESELKTAATYNNWDSKVWYIADGIYPLLRYPGFQPPKAEVLVVISNTEKWIDVKSGTTSLQVNATISNATNKGITYSLKNQVSGVSLSENGLLSFSNTVSDNSYVTVVASSVEDPSKTAEYSLKINNFDSSTYISIKSMAEMETYLVNTEDPNDLNKNYRLENNILCDGWYNSNIGANSNSVFNGVFDGNGYAIIGLQGGNALRNFGLFKEIGTNGVVKNLAISIGSRRMYVGGDSAIIASVNRGLIENVYVEGEIMCTGTYAAGIAFNNFGIIRNVVMKATILLNESDTSKASVGAVAYNNQTSGLIENCFVDKQFTGLSSITAVPNASLDVNCLSEEGMKTASNFSTLDSNIWRIENGDYPTFKSLLA